MDGDDNVEVMTLGPLSMVGVLGNSTAGALTALFLKASGGGSSGTPLELNLRNSNMSMTCPGLHCLL